MARPSAIAKSGYEEEIRHLLFDLRWGSRTTERYLELKYGVHIPHSTLRNWRQTQAKKMKDAGTLPRDWEPPRGGPEASPDERIRALMMPGDAIPDVLQKRLALIQLQEERIQLDTKHEMAMGKLFGSTVKEIEMLNRLLNDIKGDMQDIGLWPTREGQPSIVNNIQANAVAASAQPAPPQEELVVPEDALRKMGRMLLQAKDDDDYVVERVD